MRASFEQVRAGLLHEDREARSVALRYFGRSSIADESVTATAIAAIERFGHEQSFDYSWPLAELPQTPESVDWAVRNLKAKGLSDRQFIAPLVRLLLGADPKLTSPRRDEILSLDGLEDAEQAQFELRWEIESWPSERLWDEIRAICYEGRDQTFAGDFRYRDAQWMIEEISRRGERFPDWGLRMLETRIPDEAWQGNPDKWMQPLLAILAGRSRYEPAVGALIADLHVEDEVGNQASQAALVRIGTDDIVARILAQWHGASENFRSYAMDVLAGIRSDAAVMAQLKLFPRPDADPVIEYIAAIQLVESLSSEANEAVLRYLDERGFDDDVAILRRLSGSSALLGQELPDLGERLARAIERQAVEGREFEREMDRFRRRLMQLQAAPVIELDEEEQLPPVDSFVVGPIRVTKTAGRNDPCPCGSGRKFKKCCWGQSELVDAEASAPQ